MYQDLLLYFPRLNGGVKSMRTDWQVFSRQFAIVHELVNTAEDWKIFLKQAGLPLDFKPDYSSSGFCSEAFNELCELGYIENTEFDFMECFAYNGKVFASPINTNLQSGKHISKAWDLFIEYFEQTNNCKLYFK